MADVPIAARCTAVRGRSGCAEPDLLRRIDAQAGHFGQALHSIVVVSEQLRHLLIELGEVVFDEAQFIERQLH